MKKRYLIIAAAVLVGFGLWRIYANNQSAVKQTQAIIAADVAGSDIKAQTDALAAFVYGHMGASVRYELTGSYNRAVAAAKSAAQPQVSDSLYAQATAACATHNPVAQAQCIQNYVSAQPAAATQAVTLPSVTSYNHQLTSPFWTPDLAGGSLLAAATLLLLTGWFWLVEGLSRRH
jgi:hypothetical protein